MNAMVRRGVWWSAAAVIMIQGVPQALAQQSGAGLTNWYIGAGIGRSTTSFDASDFSSGIAGVGESQDKTKSAYKVFLGYDFNRNWALEGGYTSLGKPNYTWSGLGQATSHETAWSAALKGTLPLNEQFNLFGKLGITYNNVEMSGSLSGVGFSASKRRTDALYGLGGEFNVDKNLGVRLEYENYGRFGDSDNTGRTDAYMWTLGVTYKF